MYYRTIYLIMKSLAYLLGCTQIFLYGCAGPGHMPHANQQNDCEFDFPVGVVYSQYETEVEIGYVGVDKFLVTFTGLVGGLVGGAIGGAGAGLLICGPYGTGILVCMAGGAIFGTVIGVYGGLTAESSDVIKAQHFILQRLMPQMAQKQLADEVHGQLADTAANMPIFITDDALEEVHGAGNYHTLLKVTLLKSRFAISGLRRDSICLRMLAKATKVDAVTSKQLDAMTTEYQGDCLSFNDWVKNDGRKIRQGIDAGYKMLSKNMVVRFYDACSERKFRDEDNAWRYRMEVGTYHPNEDLGYADAQKRIVDIYYTEFYTPQTP